MNLLTNKQNKPHIWYNNISEKMLMMKRQKGKWLELICMDLSETLPKNHLLKQIENYISFDFIYEKVEHVYSNKGRASIDPVILIKMLIVGYIYGIKSERRLN